MPKVNPLNIRRVFCDGDIWAYRVGFIAQHEPPESPTPWFMVQEQAQLCIDNVQQKFPKADIIVCLTDPNHNYREQIAVTRPYKGTRHAPKPYWWKDLRAWFGSLDNTVMSDNEEADDVMSKVLMVDPKHTAICTEDKDLKNTPGIHFNDKTGVIENVTPAQAYRNFYTQLLTGDTVDNIPGCPGVGKAKAVSALVDCRSPEEFERVIGNLYANKVEDPEAMMVEMGRLLWMRRQDDEMWDLRANGFTTKE